MSGTTITSDENDEVANVGFEVYFKYLTYSKWTVFLISLIFLIIIAKKLINIMFDYYLLNWIKDISEKDENHWELF